MLPRLLILSTRFPYPLIGGDRIRIYHVCRVLSQQYTVDLLVINEGHMEQSYLDEITKLGIRVMVFDYPTWRFRFNALLGLPSRQPLQVCYYSFQRVQQWIDEHITEYDLVFCNHIRSAQYVINKQVRKVLDLHDAISLNYSRARQFTSGLWNFVYNIEQKRVLRFEIQAISAFDLSLIVSPIDKEFLAQHGAEENKIHVLPVAVNDELLALESLQSESNNIVFVGKMNTVANADAAVYFATEVFPLIRKQKPHAETYIVGADPTSNVQQLASIPGIHVTGKVPDHRKYALHAAVIIDPMRFGAGMQNKILEALALAKPVVASSIAVEGIDGTHGVHYLVADSPEDFASHVVRLMNDSAIRHSLGQAGRKLIQKNYSWSIVGKSLLNIITKVLNS